VNARETSDGPSLEFRTQFTTVGSYQLHVRTSREDSGSDSFHVGLESPISLPKGLKASDDWSWKTKVDDGTGDGPVAMVEILSPGEHTFRIWPREDGCQVDRIVLSTNASTDPDEALTSSFTTLSARAMFDSAM